MLDFSSSLYLGLRHESHSLEPWRSLTLGRPAALQEPVEARAAASELAALVGCPAGTLLPSTFHLFWDVLGVLSTEPIEIHMDAATYPIARWGAEHWAGKGVPLHTFARHDVRQLAQRLARRRPGTRPVVLCDGVSPGNASQPPLAAYAALARQHGGWLLIDDTQALFVWGHGANPVAPYGLGGGGSLQRHGIHGHHVAVGASLAKGFGVPVALLAGSSALLQRFEQHSASREHMSPPSMAVIQAARHAIAINREHGDSLRARLWRTVRRLRSQLALLGLATQGDDFPVQTLNTPPGTDVPRLHAELLRRDVRTVLHRDRGGGARLSFIVCASHGPAHIDRAMAQLGLALRHARVALATP
ncbi:MAG TPA: aminotransferase class I/II-fold pyridoxal phosphate-dependent enzyme [Rhizobacter sp.]|nr:aminotransferase class I/II-fold pyridoxal phosphate-dependent enzyme [Rhizobacter sp.]